MIDEDPHLCNKALGDHIYYGMGVVVGDKWRYYPYTHIHTHTLILSEQNLKN
jgi:hypothetical protein